MSLISFHFLLFALLAVCVAHLSNGRPWRPWALLALSLGFAATQMDGPSTLFVLGFCIIGYGAMIAVDGKHRQHRLSLVIIAVIGLFAWIKQYAIVRDLAAMPITVEVVGVSYILFRVVHLIVDVGTGSLSRPSPLAFANYLLFFPTFISGPLPRYNTIASQLVDRGTPPDSEEAFRCLARMVFGFGKVTLLSSALLSVNGTWVVLAAQRDGAVAAGLFLAAVSVYAVYIYINFSGYMDLVIGLTRLMGINIPENFNRPFIARNFLEFWSRWHITLSDWFRFYVFNPSLKVLVARWPARTTAPYLSAGAFFITFLLMGIWHGTTLVFVGYGLILGAGVSINRLYQVLLPRRKKTKPGLLYSAICRGAVFAYFALALGCLLYKGAEFPILLGRMGWWLPLGWVALVLVAAVALPVYDLVEASATGGLRKIGAMPRAVRLFALGFILFLLVSIDFVSHASVPPFIYKDF